MHTTTPGKTLSPLLNPTRDPPPALLSTTELFALMAWHADEHLHALKLAGNEKRSASVRAKHEARAYRHVRTIDALDILRRQAVQREAGLDALRADLGATPPDDPNDMT